MTPRRLLLAVAAVAVVGGTAGPAIATPELPTHEICVGTSSDPNHRGHNAYCVTVWRR
jgi:hypothetical protein